MLYCDLDIDEVNIFSGVLCLNLIGLKAHEYMAFVGQLFFQDTAGDSDPDYTGLTDRFQLTYAPGSDPLEFSSVPLQAIPNQQVSIGLGNQNCLITLYTRTATQTES